MDKIEEFNKTKNINEIIKRAGLNAMGKLKKYYRYTDGMAYTVSTGILHIFLYFNILYICINFLFFNF